ncbi:MAG TPA: nucleotide disphospho-sugar-binding domain-containing protein [Polyangiaceae bacterium]|jgi:MGT family glycosyltransferase|nr:nucleotide disphospho-sugar-binding domain-containing protein [Polyangiaceae bacterium]
MRVLFYSPKGTGHVNPTLPLVRGLVERGHEVTYTLTSEWRERLVALGCAYRNTGTEEQFTTADFNPGAPFYRQLLPTTAALLPRLVAEARALAPDVIVFDSCAPWGYAISEVLGVPGICSLSTLVFDRDEVRRHVGDPSERLDRVNLEALAELERRWGLDFRGRDLGLFYGRENLVFSCEELNPTRANVPGVFHFVGPMANGAGEIAGLETYAQGRCRIYLSMGTVVGGKAGLERSFFAPFIDAFSERAGYQLLLSVGASAALFGPLPNNVTVRQFVPQTAVLAHTDAFITHAGANSLHEALFNAVPLVCVPHFGDQPQNAARVADQGAGVVLPLDQISAARVSAEVERVFGESYRSNAARLAQALGACGGLERALGVVENARAAQTRSTVLGEQRSSEYTLS